MSDLLDDSKRRSSKRVAQAAAANSTVVNIGANNSSITAATASKQSRIDQARSIKQATPIDFGKLEMSSLLKYKRHYKLSVRPQSSKLELLTAVRSHFLHHPSIKDIEVISAFLYANQRYMKELTKAQQQQQKTESKKKQNQ